jgi:hypothetical protein
MEKEFVTYEQALTLKELGFDEMCFGFYRNPIVELMHCRNSEPWMGNAVVAAPLKQQVFRWFREKYGFYVELGHGPRIDFYYTIYKDSISISENNDYSTYEEAENACIDKLIEIAK